MELFHQVSHQCSKVTTDHYSSSFSSAIRLLHADLRAHIYNIYGFVRFADEISFERPAVPAQPCPNLSGV